MENKKSIFLIQKMLPLVLLGIVFLFLAITEIVSVDFGNHVDEWKIVDSVTNSLKTGVFLPGWYNYPSMSYNLALSIMIVEVVPLTASVLFHGNQIEMKKSLIEWTQTTSFKFRVRSMFIIVTLFSLFWLFLLIRQTGGNLYEALLGAALLGSSWELMYHTRWIAPDAILMQFALLSILLLMSSLDSVNYPKRFLYLGAIAAGFACSTKYTGGILLIQLLITMLIIQRRHIEDKPVLKINSIYIISVALFFVAYFSTTPGSLIQSNQFLQDVHYEFSHYKKGHDLHAVKPYFEHAWLLIKYLCLAVFSRYWPISLFFAGVVLVGSYAFYRQNRLYAMYILILPVLYILYFCKQHVMFVRNMLFVFPFLALLAAKGIIYIQNQLRNRWIRHSFLFIVVLAICINMGWQMHSSIGIHEKSAMSHEENVIKFIQNHPNTNYILSDKFKNYVEIEKLMHFKNVVDVAINADKMILSTSDLGSIPRTVRLANRFNLYQIVSGTYEVNFSYYPLQIGEENKILLVSLDFAKRLGLIQNSAL